MMPARDAADSMLLSTLLEGAIVVPVGLDCEIGEVVLDSRAVTPGAVFFARRGTRIDGARFVDDACARGAAAVVLEGEAGIARRNRCIEVRVPDVDSALGRAAALAAGDVAWRTRVIGVTGTNGKTSVCHFVAQALDAPDAGCGVIGTLGYGRPGALRDAGLTTPDIVSTHRAIAELHAAGCSRVAMEVSSHALDQGRVTGLRFSTAVFTNLSRDHLDYHGDMAEYGEAKASLFAWPALEAVVLNRDDAFGRAIAARLGSGVRLVTFGTGEVGRLPGAHLTASAVSMSTGGLEVDVDGPWGHTRLHAPLAGRFNAANLLAALGVMLAEGLEARDATARLAAVRAVPGRMEPFGGRDGKPLAVVDFSHTPDALAQALEALRAQVRGRLWCVFGCGGDRDPGKRALMGAEAARGADALVITDDNPRGEEGDRIVEDILAGIPPAARVTVERDRAAAIRLALEAAGGDDVVLIAGKGHETYQEVAGSRRLFSDAAAVRAVLGEGAR